jgi:hypothetical protein
VWQWRKYAASILPVLIACAIAAIFARTLSFGLYLDDYHHARPWTLGEVLGTFAGPFDPLGFEPPYFRPLVVVTFAIDWSLWGYNEWGYHITNIVLHATAALLLYTLLRQLDQSRWVAVVGSLFFAAIPANAATAIYISERSDAMVAIFTIAGLLVLLRFWRTRRISSLVVLNALVLLALGSKEIGVALPLLIPAFWAYVAFLHLPIASAPSHTSWWRRLVWLVRNEGDLLLGAGRWHSTLAVVIPPFALVVAYLGYRAMVLPTGVLGKPYSATVGPVHGFFSAVFWTFKAVPWEVAGWAWPLLGIALLAAAILRPRSSRWPLVALGAMWVAISCVPLSYLGQVEPRLLYVPEVGHAIVVAGVSAILAEIVRSKLAGRRPGMALASLVMFLAVGFLSLTTISLVQAQNEFLPLGPKMIHGMQLIETDLNHRSLYPRHYIEEIDQRLREVSVR